MWRTGWANAWKESASRGISLQMLKHLRKISIDNHSLVVDRTQDTLGMTGHTRLIGVSIPY